MYTRLQAAYGPQSWWPAETPMEVVIGACLTQGTSWKGVELSIVRMKTAGSHTLDGLRQISLQVLQELIRPSGFMVRKAATLKAFVQLLDEQYEGSLEEMAQQATTLLRAELLALSGIGPETADAILLYALGHPVMVVDEYLRRVMTRHGFAQDAPRPGYMALQQLGSEAFADDLPATHLEHFNEFHALIVQVGKEHCGPVPRCEGCPLRIDFTERGVPAPGV